MLIEQAISPKTLERIFGEGATELANELENKTNMEDIEVLNKEEVVQSNTLEGATEGTSNKRLRGQSVSGVGDLGKVDVIKNNIGGVEGDTNVLEAKKQKLGDEDPVENLSPGQVIKGEEMNVNERQPLQEPDLPNQDSPGEV